MTFLSLSFADPTHAQQPAAGDVNALAKASQNPVGDLISLPFQFNFNTGAAFEDRTIPLGIGIAKTTVFNGRPMSLGAQYYYNVKRPDGTAATQLRFVVALLYPIAPKK